MTVKLTLVIWLLTGSQMVVEADGFKTEAQCQAHAARVVSDLIKRDLPFAAIGTRCEPYQQT